MTKAVIRRGVAPRPVSGVALAAGLAAGLCGYGGAVSAGPRAAADGGTLLTFGVGLRLASDSNPTLAPVSPGSQTTAAINLSFGLIQNTARSKLALGVTGDLGQVTGADSFGASGLNNPGITLAYALTSGLADFTLNAALNTINLAQTNDVTVFQTGTGKRRTASLNAGLSWGNTAPFGAGLTLGVTNATYLNNPAAGFGDSTTVNLGATAHTDLTPVLHLGFGLNDSHFVQYGSATQDTPGGDVSLTLDHKTGSYVANLATNHTPQGQRSTLDFSNQMTLPAGSLYYSLGATRSAAGKTYAIGSLNYAKDLALGTLNLDLTRAVQTDTYTNAEVLLANANASYTHAVTPSANLSLALNWANQFDTGTTNNFTNASFSATWTQGLTADWALDLGYTLYQRNQTQVYQRNQAQVGFGQSNTVFLNLHRNFSIRY